ncbi:YoaK family protein [uncultured Roseibium sp.]|uniref:YoaK family protein n=1 Tax=uncultured Roseibium sp. TaxID=1936171 RepID=UPI003216A7D6
MRLDPRGYLHHSRPMIANILAFCACFIDVVCILGLFHTFTAFITGTLVVLSTELFQTPDSAPLKLIVIGNFFISTLGWYALVVRMRRSGRGSLRLLLLLEAGLLAAFMLIAALSAPLSGPLALATVCAVVLSTYGMSLQNVIMSEILNCHAPTTFMTGNTIRLVAGLVDGLSAPEEVAQGPRSRAMQHARVIIAFTAGGLVGGYCMSKIGFWSLGIPVALIALVGLAQPHEPLKREKA